MTDYLDLLYAGRAQDAIEVEDIIGKMVVASRSYPAAVAVTAAIGGDDAQGSLNPVQQSVDEELPTKSEIEKAVDQQQWSSAGIAPFQIMNRQPPTVGGLVTRHRHQLETILKFV